MKLGTRIKVIASLPTEGQDGITHLIGKTFTVRSIDRDSDGRPTGRVSIDAEDGKGLIVLQPNEYQVTH